MSRFWKVPATLWQGETVFIVGGGPSLKGMDLSGLAERRTIAVNNAFRITPNPDVIFYADTRWWGWNGKEIALDFPGRVISTCSASQAFLDPRVCRMGRCYRFTEEGGAALSHDPTLLAGPDSGYMAMNLAYLFGAKRVVLLGFDMGFVNGEAHWHKDHEVPTPESNYTDLFAPRYPALVKALKEVGVEVIRCTPSRLDYIPEVPLQAALALPNRQHG